MPAPYFFASRSRLLVAIVLLVMAAHGFALWGVKVLSTPVDEAPVPRPLTLVEAVAEKGQRSQTGAVKPSKPDKPLAAADAHADNQRAAWVPAIGPSPHVSPAPAPLALPQTSVVPSATVIAAANTAAPAMTAATATPSATSGKEGDVAAAVRAEGGVSGSALRAAQPGTALKVELPSSAPDHLHNPTQEYPPLSRSRGEQGTVLLSVLVSADGKVREVTVKKSSGFVLLDRSAVRTVLGWTFVPGKRDGVPTEMLAEQPIPFRLND
jgi:protein TonB